MDVTEFVTTTMPVWSLGAIAAVNLAGRQFVSNDHAATVLPSARRAELKRLGVDEIPWTPAGHLTLDAVGHPRLPTLPHRPGLLRIEANGPVPDGRTILITEGDDLDQTVGDGATPGLRFALNDLRLRLTRGGDVEVGYLVDLTTAHGSVDLANCGYRRAVLDLARSRIAYDARA